MGSRVARSASRPTIGPDVSANVKAGLVRFGSVVVICWVSPHVAVQTGTVTSNLGEVPREDPYAVTLWSRADLILVGEIGSKNCHSKRLESVGNREG